MSNSVPNFPDGYKPVTIPQSLKVIQGGSNTGDQTFHESRGHAMSETEHAKNVFKKFTCLYLPVNDRTVHEWHVKHFNGGGTREHSLFFSLTEEQGKTCSFLTDEWILGEPYEMFAVRFETDAIEELYDRLSAADVKLEPLLNEDGQGQTFVYTDPQGNKYQVWQRPETITQPLRDGVKALIRVAALFFPATDPEATKKWYSDVAGVELSESGQPMTVDGSEIYILRSLEPGRTLSFFTGRGPVPNRSLVNIEIDGLDDMHSRMVEQGQWIQEKILDREGCGRQFQLYDPDGNSIDIWELQTMVWKQSKVDSPNWKEQFKFGNCDFEPVDVDTFLTKVINGDPGTRHRQVQILNCAVLRESDPEGLEKLVETLTQFGEQYPEWAFNIVFREGKGGIPSEPIGVLNEPK